MFENFSKNKFVKKNNNSKFPFSEFKYIFWAYVPDHLKTNIFFFKCSIFFSKNLVGFFAEIPLSTNLFRSRNIQSRIQNNILYTWLYITASNSFNFNWNFSKLQIALKSPERTKHVCNLRWTSILLYL